MDTSHPSSRPKILIISPWERRWSLGAGAGVSDDDNFIERASESLELHFLRPRGRDRSGQTVERVHFYPNFLRATRRFPTAVKRILWPLCFGTVTAARALAVGRRIRPDLVLGHSHHAAFPAWLAGKCLRVPTGVKLFGVMDLVHTEWPRWKYVSKNLEQMAAFKVPHRFWIILDDGTRGREAAIRHGVREEKIHFLPNGIDLQWMSLQLDRREIRRDLGVPEEALVVLFLARLVPSKRPQSFIESIPRVKQLARRPVFFIVAGDGTERGRCESRAIDLGIERDVLFTGAVPHERVPRLMAASDLFVSTSRLTNVAIPTCEALVCGVPVVAFDAGNTREIVRDGVTGRAVADGDLEALARAVAGLLEDEALRRRMSTEARELARSRFVGWAERIQEEVRIIGEAIHAAPGGLTRSATSPR